MLPAKTILQFRRPAAKPELAAAVHEQGLARGAIAGQPIPILSGEAICRVAQHAKSAARGPADSTFTQRNLGPIAMSALDGGGGLPHVASLAKNVRFPFASSRLRGTPSR